MGYFKSISDRCELLTTEAQKYLDGLPFISNDECAERIVKWASGQVDRDERGYVIYNGKNEFAELILDAGVPYYDAPKNGSLHHTLGWSTTAQEANVRSILEYVEGRQEKWIKFRCLVNLDEIGEHPQIHGEV